ncbi:T9SS type A sorting domain-containing protein [Neolewinella persica]|uniref:T9SS type A sorting domain-containing protein n=1 Tax=Neolewinella persica TaxID=70998 RepID=UPI00047559B6|nr:T9SS type A sorting domain-containing protein [Neolewinella persica]
MSTKKHLSALFILLLPAIIVPPLSGQVAPSYFEYFVGDTVPGNISQTNAAGSRLTFLQDTECESLNISVTDPTGDPLPPFNAIQFNPFDVNGVEITDLTGNLNLTMRVRSVEGINISVLFRSGGGTIAERTLRKDIDVPGGLTEWTEFMLTWEAGDLDGFVPADFVDMWVYLDRGVENFAGNFLDIDHIVVGATPDAALNSDCSQEEVPANFIEQFTATSSTNILGGAEIRKLTLGVTDCEELSVSVTDTMGAPYQAFRPIVIDPVNANGVSITNIEGIVTVFLRARAAEVVPISVLLRSGDGSVNFRTATQTQYVQGDLNGWSNLIYVFTGDALAGFDPTNLIDLWIYLDRDNNNFPGNELYIDYIALGELPDTMANSPCGLPDIFTTGIRAAVWGKELLLYPNPTTNEVWLELPINSIPGGLVRTRMFNSLGQEVQLQSAEIRSKRTRISLHDQPSGTYYLLLTDRDGTQLSRSIIKH